MATQDQVFHIFDRWVKESADFQDEHRRNADTNWEYRDGNQWEDKIKKAMALKGQAPTVMNLIFPLLNALAAVESGRRTSYSVVAKKPEVESTATILTKLLNEVLTNNNFKFYLGRCWINGCTTGIYWFEGHIVKDPDTGEQIINLSMRPFEEFYYSPRASRYDLSDSKYISREVPMTIEEIEERWGEEKAKQVQHFYNEKNEEFQGREAEARQVEGSYTYIDREASRVNVHEMYYRLSSGKVKHVIFTGPVFFKGEEELNSEKNKSPYKYNFIPFVPYVCMWDKKGRPKAVVEIARPLQDVVNKAQSKTQALIAAKGCIAEEGAFVDPMNAKKDWAKPDRFILLNKGGLKMIQEESNLSESQNIMTWIQLSMQIMQRIMGTNDSLVGQGGVNARTASQEQSRVAQGEGMQTYFLESLYLTKLAIAKMVLKMIGQFYDKERIVRSVGPDGAILFEKVNSTIEVGGETHPFNEIIDILEFDVNLKEEVPFTNAMELTSRRLTELTTANPNITPASLPRIIENMSGITDKEAFAQEVKAIFQAQPEG